MPSPRIVVVAGPSGAGKSTVGSLLAARLDWPWCDGDALHPAANIAKMASGVPLDDVDRAPWLTAVNRWMQEHAAGVIACSALTRRYRDRLREGCPTAWFVLLSPPGDVLRDRVAARVGHFMPPNLTTSQLVALEPLGADEPGIAVDGTRPADQVMEAVVGALAAEADRPTSDRLADDRRCPNRNR